MEISYPRGGIKVSQQKTLKTGIKEHVLFKTKKDSEIVRKKKKNRKYKNKETAVLDENIPIVIEPLTFKTLSTDMVVLGCIETVREYELKVILPGGVVGSVSIANISNSYTGLLKKYTEDPENLEETVVTLPAMFVVGQPVICKVISVRYNPENSKSDVSLSLNPRDVNGRLITSCLYNGMILQSAVVSIEDHGYIIDIGIPDIKCFLTHSAASCFIQTKNEGRPLAIGQVISCVINEPNIDHEENIEIRTLQLNIKNSIVDHVKIPMATNITLHSLCPGVTLSATITDVKENGLIVSYLDYTGCVYKDHLKHIWDQSASYKIGQQVEGTLLYIHPMLHHLYLSLSFSVSPRKIKKMFGNFRIGEIVEAKVFKVDKMIGVYFSINNKIKGLCTKKNLSDNEIENINEHFLLNSTYKCRIIGVNYIDHLLKLSTKKSVIDEKYIPYEELQAGAVFTGTVKKIGNGMIIKLAHSIQGYVRDIDISENLLQKPEKLFQPGAEVKCRILKANLSQDPPSLLLTCKKRMVNSKFSIFTKYEDAFPGMITEGTIALVKQNGLLVVFYNDVKGWIPVKELSINKLEYPEKIFKRGQVVKCCVLSCNAEKQILKLSLKIENKIPYKMKDMTQFEIGKIVAVKVTAISEKGLDVVVLSSDIAAFLPVGHLSDYSYNCIHLLSTYEIGNVINEVVCFSFNGILIVSLKKSLIQASKSKKFIKEFSDLQIGMTIPVVVNQFTSYGIFLEISNNLLGLVPLRLLLNERVDEVEKSGFILHQSLKAKVIELNEEKQRILLSTKLADCYFGEADESLDLLENYLEDWEKINYFNSRKEINKKLSQLKVGQIVDAKITHTTDLGVLCEVEKKVSGLATNKHIGTQKLKFKIGDCCKGIILYVDLINQCVELSLDWQLIKTFQKTRDNESSKTKVNQIIKCQAILIKNDFVLVSLKNHAVGSLAYLPTHKHLNDFRGRNDLYTVGECYHIVIKRYHKNNILGVLKQHDHTLTTILEKAMSGKSSFLKQNNETQKKCCIKSKNTVNLIKNSQKEKISNDEKLVTFQNNNKDEIIKKRKQEFCLAEESDKVEAKNNNSKETSDKNINKRKLNQLQEESNKSSNKSKKTCLHNEIQIKRNEQFLLKEKENYENEIEFIDLLDNSNETKKESTPTIFQDEITGNIIEVGKIYKAIIKSVKMFQLNIIINGTYGRVHITEISDNVPEGINPLESFKINQELEVSILGFRYCKTHRYLPISHARVKLFVECSLRHTYSPTCFKIGQLVTVFIKEFRPSYISVWLNSEESGKIYHLNLSNNAKVLKNPAAEFHAAQAIKAIVYNINEEYVELSKIGICKLVEGKPVTGQILSARADLGMFLHLPFGYRGTVALTDLKDNYKSADTIMNWLLGQRFVRCQILSVNDETKQCVLSTRSSRLKGLSRENIPDIEINEFCDVSVGDSLQGYVTSLNQEGIIVMLGRSVNGFIPKSKIPSNIIYSKEKIPIGSVVNVRIFSINDNEIILRLLSKKLASEENSNEMEDLEELNIEDENQFPRLEFPQGFSWNIDVNPSSMNIVSDSENEVEEKIVKKKKLNNEKEEENYLYQRERQLMDTEREPETVDDYDRLVLSSPDNSMVWLKYMAFHLQQAEIEKAKAVGLRALKTISFREEQEKLNIWVALLNLEILYGATDTLKETLQKALQYNEPIKVYNHMVSLYVKSNKYEEAEEMYKIMVRKFKHDKDVYINFGLFYMKQNKIDAARNVMQRSLNSLENKKDHVDVIAKFAQMEFKYGDPERGKTMFEGILTNYKKRTDLKSLYMDLLKKQNKIDTK